MERISAYIEDILKRNENIRSSDESQIKDRITKNIEKDFYEAIRDEKNILKAIASRNWITAPGIDGLDYAVYKYGGKEAAIAIRKIIQYMWECERTPIQFKTSKTIMVYERGNVNNERNWRPLSISDTMYRIIMVIINWHLMEVNQKYRFINDQQKGFIAGTSEMIENILTISELYNDEKSVRGKQYET